MKRIYSKYIPAIGIALFADGIDYLFAPVSSVPIIGDIGDVVVTSLLYFITKSKLATAINSLEFIPFVGDAIPTYTISTLIWITKDIIYDRKYKENNKLNKTIILNQKKDYSILTRIKDTLKKITSKN